jgi:hypothetical protein
MVSGVKSIPIIDEVNFYADKYENEATKVVRVDKRLHLSNPLPSR